MKKIYLASPFFNDIEIARMEAVRDILRNEKDLQVFVPNEHQNKHLEFGSKEWRKATWQGDVDGIKGADVVVAIISNGNYSDSGTAWECGYAYANNIPVVVVNLSDSENPTAINLMISDSLHAYINNLESLRSYDFNNMPVITYDNYVW